jgi:predicted metal-dependent peptidase
MNQLERIRKQHVKIMAHKRWCAFGPLVAAGKTTCSHDLPTAATNGIDKVYNPDFVKSLSDEELRFVILHEATHVAYLHLDVWKDLWKENPRLTNIAADHFVNLSLHDTNEAAGDGFIKMPEVGIQPDPQYRGLSVKQIYNKLKQDGEDGGGGGGGDGFDEHQWEDAQGRDADEQKKVADEVGKLIRQGEIVRKQRSKDGAGNADGVFGDLLNPKVNWREVLRQFVSELCQGKDESSWRKPNRRYLANDVYMPSMQGITMGPLVVGFDTSGSCFGSDYMTRFVSEISTIIEQVQPEKVTVVYWDTAVVGHQTFENGQFAVHSMKPKGGGGTRGDVLFKWLEEQRIKPAAIIQFTDGEVGSWGQSSVPTLWCIAGNAKAPWGTTINIEV